MYLYNNHMDAAVNLPTSRSLVATKAISLPRRKAFAELAKSLPMNDLGLPKFLYRTDMIPGDIFERRQSDREEILTAALIPVEYGEGFPALEDGQPIWSQLPFESPEAYRIFTYYLKEGLEEGVRLVENISLDLKAEMPILMDFFHLYYWKIRSKAYDQFITIVHEKKRLRRLMQCDNDHYILADNLLKKCSDYFNAIEWETIDPAVVARMMPQLMEIQRKSSGEKQFGENPTPQSVEVILRQMTRTDHAHQESQDAERASTLDVLLSNPDAAAAAQELIIKLGGKVHD